MGSKHFTVSSVQSLSHVWLFATLWTTACQASLSITNSWSSPKHMSIEAMMPSNHLILSSSVALFSFGFQSFPASGSFPKNQFFASGGQSTGASVLPVDIQGWFPLGWTGLISLKSMGPSSPREYSPAPQFESINSSALSFLHSPTLTSIHDHWKRHSFDYMDFCRQSDVSAF